MSRSTVDRAGHSSLRVAHRNGAAVVTLDRPGSLNALDGRLRRDLHAAIRDIASDRSIGAIVLTGAGRAFCSGSDIRSFEGTDSRRVLLDEYRPLVQAIGAAPVPVIAAVHGLAAGAGVSLALACDLIVMGESARFELSFIHLGLVPDAGSTMRLVQGLGRHRAAEVSWTGGRIDASVALSTGLVNRLVADDEVLSTAVALAIDLAAGPRDAIAESKRLIRLAMVSTEDELFELEADAQGRLRGSDEHRTRLDAWRAPRVERDRTTRTSERTGG